MIATHQVGRSGTARNRFSAGGRVATALSFMIAMSAWLPAVEAAPDAAPQIVGGEPANPSAYPWHVGLIAAEYSAIDVEAQYCGGTLIAPNWVLTAAHCIWDRHMGMPFVVEERNVLVGTHSLLAGGSRIAVKQMVVHPGFVRLTLTNDFALLELDTPVHSPTIALVTPVTEPTLAPPGAMSTVTGWGATLADPPRPTELLEVQVPIITNTACNDAYGAAYPEITADMMCAGFAEGGKDSCYADSGGPLFVPDGVGGFKQAGIVSGGIGCAEAGPYGVYVRVSAGFEWIHSLVAPAMPAIVSPPGGARISGLKSRFKWSAIPEAATYEVEIVRGAFSHSVTVPATEAGCPTGVGTCSIVVPDRIPIGAGKWRALARNQVGASDLTAHSAFEVVRRPVRPLTTKPATTTDATPDYVWKNVKGDAVTHYQVVVRRNGKIVSQRRVSRSAAACRTDSTTNCRLTASDPLAGGKYKLTVRARNRHGFGPLSAAREFMVGR